MAIKQTATRTYCYLFEDRFVAKVEDGTKTQTIRKRGAVPPKPGDTAQLEQWEGVAYRSKRRVLRRAEIKEVLDIEISKDGIKLPDLHALLKDLPSEWLKASRESLDAFAQADGFENWDDLIDYFEAKGWLPFAGILITWQP